MQSYEYCASDFNYPLLQAGGIKILMENSYDETAKELLANISNTDFVSKFGKLKSQLWIELCDFISKHPHNIYTFNVENLIRWGLEEFPDVISNTWKCLADYYANADSFDQACNVFEEALGSVKTLNDFSQVYEAYVKLLKTKINKLESQKFPGWIINRLYGFLANLAKRRKLLLNSLYLRQNPHNVHDWLQRVKFLKGNTKEIIKTYVEAIQKVNPKLAQGKYHILFLELGKFFESLQQVNEARVVYEEALKCPFEDTDDLATVWCERALLEVCEKDFKRALLIIKQATEIPPEAAFCVEEALPVEKRLFKSLKIWLLRVGIEQAVGDIEPAKSDFEKIIDLNIATPEVYVTYGEFLMKFFYTTEALKVYEKGVSIFNWPEVKDVWKAYLTKSIDLFGQVEPDRIRLLFTRSFEICPPNLSASLYLLCAKFEENVSVGNAMIAYKKALTHAQPNERLQVFSAFIKKASEFYSPNGVREIYQLSITNFPEPLSKQICLKYADWERRNGEIDRARLILSRCSSKYDPKMHPEFWKYWERLEVEHGNDFTKHAVLNIKRNWFPCQTQVDPQNMFALSLERTEAHNLQNARSNFLESAEQQSSQIEVVSEETGERNGINQQVEANVPNQFSFSNSNNEEMETELSANIYLGVTAEC